MATKTSLKKKTSRKKAVRTKKTVVVPKKENKQSIIISIQAADLPKVEAALLEQLKEWLDKIDFSREFIEINFEEVTICLEGSNFDLHADFEIGFFKFVSKLPPRRAIMLRNTDIRNISLNLKEDHTNMFEFEEDIEKWVRKPTTYARAI